MIWLIFSRHNRHPITSSKGKMGEFKIHFTLRCYLTIIGNPISINWRWLSYFHSGISYTDKTSLYWIKALVCIALQYLQCCMQYFVILGHVISRHHSGYGLSLWKEAILCNAFSHWRMPYPEWFLIRRFNWILPLWLSCCTSGLILGLGQPMRDVVTK